MNRWIVWGRLWMRDDGGEMLVLDVSDGGGGGWIVVDWSDCRDDY